MNCIKCNDIIPEGRLRAIPGTTECITCSSTKPFYGRAVITGKDTYSEVEIIKDPAVAEEIRKLEKDMRLESKRKRK